MKKVNFLQKVASILFSKIIKISNNIRGSTYEERLNSEENK